MEYKPASLFVGRFQPFHLGHFLVIEGMTKVSDRIVIAIGSSQLHDKNNPFTVTQRKEMMQRTLQAANLIPLFDINFIEVPDQESDSAWAEHVLELAGPVKKLWTGNEDTAKCFEGKLEIQKIKEVPNISSTQIREMIKTGGDWESKVPKEVYQYIKEISLN